MVNIAGVLTLLGCDWFKATLKLQSVTCQNISNGIAADKFHSSTGWTKEIEDEGHDTEDDAKECQGDDTPHDDHSLGRNTVNHSCKYTTK